MIEIASFGVPIQPGPRRTVIVGTYVLDIENEANVVVSLSPYSTIQLTSLDAGIFKAYSIYNTTGAGAVYTWVLDPPVKEIEHTDLSLLAQKPVRLIDV